MAEPFDGKCLILCTKKYTSNEIENNMEGYQSYLFISSDKIQTLLRPLDSKYLRCSNVYTRPNKMKIKENHTDMYYYFCDLTKVKFDNVID